MAGYWPSFFLRVYGPAKKERGQYPVLLNGYISTRALIGC